MQGACTPAASAARSALRWQSQSSSSRRPAARAAANRRSGLSRALPRGPRASASQPMTRAGRQFDDRLEAGFDGTLGEDVGELGPHRARDRARRGGWSCSGDEHLGPIGASMEDHPSPPSGRFLAWRFSAIRRRKRAEFGAQTLAAAPIGPKMRTCGRIARACAIGRSTPLKRPEPDIAHENVHRRDRRRPLSPGASPPGPRPACATPARGRARRARRARRRSARSRSMPVSIPISCEHRDEVLGRDVARRALRDRAAAQLAERGLEARARRPRARRARSPGPGRACCGSAPSARRRRRGARAPRRRTRGPGAGSPSPSCRRSRSPARPRRQPLGDLEHAVGLDVPLVRAAEGHRDDALAAQPRLAGARQHALEAGQRLLDRAVDVRAVVRLARGQEDVDLVERPALAAVRVEQRERRVEPPLVRDQDADRDVLRARRSRRAPPRRRRAAG